MNSSHFDVFISYRRSNASELARYLHTELGKRGYAVFLDVADLESGPFGESLLSHIERSKDLIAILTPQSMDGPLDEDDWFRRELAEAFRHGKNVIPIMKEGFDRSSLTGLPQDIALLPEHQWITYSHEHADACIGKLIKYLRSQPRPRVSPPPPPPPPPCGWLCIALILAIIAFAGITWWNLTPSIRSIADAWSHLDIAEKAVYEEPRDPKLAIKETSAVITFIGSHQPTTSTEYLNPLGAAYRYRAEAWKLLGKTDEGIRDADLAIKTCNDARDVENYAAAFRVRGGIRYARNELSEAEEDMRFATIRYLELMLAGHTDLEGSLYNSLDDLETIRKTAGDTAAAQKAHEAYKIAESLKLKRERNEQIPIEEFSATIDKMRELIKPSAGDIK